MKQRNIISLLRKEFGHHEVTVFSASTKNRAGVLDCEIAYRGQSFWVEIKIGKDKLSELQRKFIERHHHNSMCLFYVDYLSAETMIHNLRIHIVEPKIIKLIFDDFIKKSII